MKWEVRQHTDGTGQQVAAFGSWGERSSLSRGMKALGARIQKNLVTGKDINPSWKTTLGKGQGKTYFVYHLFMKPLKKKSQDALTLNLPVQESNVLGGEYGGQK